MIVFGLTQFLDRPLNFSAAYALTFCCGVYLPRKLAWWLPLVTLAAVDCIENWHRGDPFYADQFFLYGAFALIIWLGTRFRPDASWTRLLAGGLLGALVFYLVTNTASWYVNPFGSPEYTKDFRGWFTALTKGISGFPATWTFFRNTMLSGGLFTGLFVGAMKLSESLAAIEEPEPSPDRAREEDAEKPEPEPEPSA